MMISLVLMGLVALSASALPLANEQEVIYLEFPEQNMLINEAMNQNLLSDLQCVGTMCSGCLKIHVPFIPFLIGDVCTSIELFPATMDIDVKVSINGMQIIHKTISTQPTPKLCVRFLPFNAGEFCATATDIKIEPTHLGGCLMVDAKVFNNPVLNVNLGCFGFPLPKLPGKK